MTKYQATIFFVVIRLLALALFCNFFSIAGIAQQNEINELINEIEKSTNSDEKINLNLQIARTYYSEGDIKNALRYSYNAKGHLKNYTGDNLKGDVHLHLGNFLLELSRYAEALNQFQISYKAYSQVDNIAKMTTVLANMGVVFERLNNPELALEYVRRVIKNRVATNDSIGLATAYTNIGNIYEILEKYDMAYKYYRDAAYIDSVYEEIRNLSVDYNNLGYLFEQLEDYGTAMQYYEKSLAIDLKEDDKHNQSIVLVNISSIHMKLGNLEKARFYSLKSLDLGKSTGSLISLSKSLDLLSQIEAKANNNQASLKYYKLFMEIKDSINQNIAKMKNESKETIPYYDPMNEDDSIKEAESNSINDLIFYVLSVFLLAILIVLLLNSFKQ